MNSVAADLKLVHWSNEYLDVRYSRESPGFNPEIAAPGGIQSPGVRTIDKILLQCEIAQFHSVAVQHQGLIGAVGLTSFKINKMAPGPEECAAGNFQR